MKRYTNTHLEVNIDIDLDDVESIRFIFVQNDRRVVVDYPSEQAFRSDDKVLLALDRNQTGGFIGGKRVRMDTYVKMKDSSDNPQTEVIEFYPDETLFREEELPND